MKIRSKLIIIALVPISIFLCSSLIQYRVSRETDRLNYRAIKADELYKLFSGLNVLTHEHYFYNEPRVHQQWESAYRKIGEKLSAGEALFIDPDEVKIIREVSRHYRAIGYLFTQYGPHPQDNAARSRDTDEKRFGDRLTSRMLQELQAVEPLLSNLHDLNYNQAIRLGTQQDRLELLFLLTISLSVPGISWLVYRAFDKPVIKLRSGIEIMSSGNLDHRIALSSHDELGELAGAFDRMAEQRQVAENTILRMNEELEQRIVERTEEVRQSEARYRSLFANNHTVMLLIDPVSREIVDANPAAEEFYGYPAAQLRQMRIDQINSLSREEIVAEMALACEQQRAHFLFQHRLADGNIRDVEVFSGPLMANDRQLLYSIIHDVTERRQLEAETLRAREAAEQASRAKSEFLANMSHEIRTPMNAIIGLGHLLLQTEMTAKQREYLTKMHAAAQSLLGIINDILDFSKIEAGRLQLESVEFRLADVLDSLADIITVWGEAKGLEILYRVDPKIPARLRGDPLRLTQILTNLMNNAVKFTEQGEVVLRVEVEELRQGGDFVTLLFSVHDTGIGMSEEQLEQLFLPFTQMDSSTTRRYGGTGLGLSICRRLAEMMGGHIWAESRAGEGSTFYFTVNFLHGSQMLAEPGTGTDLCGTRVLVVDDNAVSRTILMELLTDMGMAAVSTSSGTEAVEELLGSSCGKNPYKLLIIDWRMPGMDGIETLERIRTVEGICTMPVVIMVSAFSTDEIRRRAGELSVKAFLAKPFHPQRLHRAVCQALGSDAPAVQQGETAAVPAGEAYPGLEGRKVLLVEDHAVNRLFAEEVLKNVGIEVVAAVNGREAVDLAERGVSFDAILMDIQMPEMDGYEATGRIRALPSCAEVPIIAMTAHAMTKDRERCLEAGMNAHISKPIDVMELYATLLRYFPQGAPIGVREAQVKGGRMTVSGLPDLSGIDAAALLDKVDGNIEALKKILEGFVTDKRMIADEIGNSLVKADWPKVEHLAHGLKGVAGNLSADALAGMAAGIEAACYDRSLERALELLMPLKQQLAELIASIEQFIAPAPAPPACEASTEIPLEQVIPVLRAAAHLLRLHDLDAVTQCRRLRELLARGEFQLQVLEIEQQVGRLDFKGALPRLVSLAAALDVALEEG